MSVSLVVGGQYGSEGKGKVAHYLAEHREAASVVRVGGPNSGHTAVKANRELAVLRQLPTGALLDGVACILPPGTLIDPPVMLEEMERHGVDPNRIKVDPLAFVVTQEDKDRESRSDIGSRIGSTCSGTGAAVRRRAARNSRTELAESDARLAPFLADTLSLLRDDVISGKRVIVEGTQGYGLSGLHSPHWPYATSRDTTAAAALSESGLSPIDVDEVVLVIRAFPIRVAGRSGPFNSEELSWADISASAGRHVEEFTSVTGNTRRVGRFDPEIVKRAIRANAPTTVVLNHVDYVAGAEADGRISVQAESFIHWVEQAIGREINLVGVSPSELLRRNRVAIAAA